MPTMNVSSQTLLPGLPARRDTKAWRLQTWASFGLAALICGAGLAWLPGEPIERAFMVMGYAFCVVTVFALSKHVRDRQEAQDRDTPLWGLVVWAGFALAVLLTGWGLSRMQVEPAYQAFLLVSWLFLTSTAFTLAKMLRDRHEADYAERAATLQEAAGQRAL